MGIIVALLLTVSSIIDPSCGNITSSNKDTSFNTSSTTNSTTKIIDPSCGN